MLWVHFQYKETTQNKVRATKSSLLGYQTVRQLSKFCFSRLIQYKILDITPEARAESIRKGLQYLELQLETNKFPYSSDCFGTCRDDLYSVGKFPQYPFGDLHDAFNMYIVVLFLEKHLPSSFRSKLIETIRPKKVGQPVNFFGDIDGDVQRFPNDPETTAVCYHALLNTKTVTEMEIASLAKSVYENVNDDGVIQLYYVPKENPRYNRLDAVSIINMLRFAYALGEENLVKLSEDYVFDWLNSGKYKRGTLYYPSAHTFLYFCSRLTTTNCRTKARFMGPLQKEFAQINQEDLKFPLDYALNVLTGVELGVRNENVIEKLRDMQTEDGSWPADALYATNKTKVYFGSKSLTTIFAILALIETNSTIIE